MTNPMTLQSDLLALLPLLEKATPGPWLYRGKSNTFHKPPPEGTAYSYGESIMDADEDFPTFKDADVDFILAAVNFIREHGPAILATASEQAPVAIAQVLEIKKHEDDEAWFGRVEFTEPLKVGDLLYSSPAHTSEARDAVPKDNDGKEQDAFEAWAKAEGFDMVQHPLHWLFLNELTNAARKGWRGALNYVNAAMRQEAGDE